jgi:hypothetical protein
MLLIGGLAPQTGVKDCLPGGRTSLDEWVPRICGNSMESDTGNNALSLSTVQLETLRLITAGCPRRKPASEVGRFERLESYMR